MALKPGTQKQRNRAAQRNRNAARRSATRGAQAKKSKPLMNWRLLGKGVAVSVVTACVALVGLRVEWSQAIEKIESSINRPVSSISIKGEFSHLSKVDIQEMILAHLNGNFIDLNLTQLRTYLESHAWVQQASVRRIWPDRLEILVVEQKPIARWAGAGFINREGNIVLVENNSSLSGLPIFEGPEQAGAEITRAYLAITELLSDKGFGVAGIKVDETLSWRIHLNEDLELVIGQYDVLTKLKNFLLVYEQELKNTNQRLARVDMRYEDGMAVSWHAQGTIGQLQASR